MRNFCHFVAVLSATFLLAGSALAQRAGVGRGNVAALLGNPGVQKELKLTEEQIDKAKKLAQDLREKYKDDFAKVAKAQPEERREKFQELSKKISAEAQKSLNGILKPEQLKRLRQIQLQQVGLDDADAQAALKLTDPQKKQLHAIAEEAGKQMREIIQNAQGNFQEAMEKIDKLRKETREKQAKVLSADQTKAWKALQGEPFELKLQRRKKDRNTKSRDRQCPDGRGLF